MHYFRGMGNFLFEIEGREGEKGEDVCLCYRYPLFSRMI